MKFNSRNIFISPTARIGMNVRIGDNSSIYDNVEIGDNTIICDNCTIGEPLKAYYFDDQYQQPPTVIGANSLIRSFSIIYADCQIGVNFNTGHRVTIRENTIIGSDCSIGTQSDLQGDITIGNFCRLHSNVHLASGSKLGNFVFMYPFTVMTNDPNPPSETIKGASVGDYSQICVHTTLLPGVKVGENCLIGANSLVSQHIKDYSLATGNPIKIIMDLRELKVLGVGQYYPWMNHFDRGMPWEKDEFEQWLEKAKK